MTRSFRILEDLYEAHGDTLAVQYGGSQLVHGYDNHCLVATVLPRQTPTLLLAQFNGERPQNSRLFSLCFGRVWVKGAGGG